LFEPYRGAYPAEARSDDQHVEVAQHRRIGALPPGEAPGIRIHESRLFDRERYVLGRNGLAGTPVHHVVEPLVGRGRGQAPVAVEVGLERLERHRADGRLILGREAAFHRAHHSRARRGKSLQQATVAGQLHDRR
jgi:hypothetical protein